MPVTQLRCDINFDGEACPLLEPVFRNQTSIIGGTASRNGQSRYVREIKIIRQSDGTVDRIDISRERVAHHLRLLVDFLGHEMTMATFVNYGGGGI